VCFIDEIVWRRKTNLAPKVPLKVLVSLSVLVFKITVEVIFQITVIYKSCKSPDRFFLRFLKDLSMLENKTDVGPSGIKAHSLHPLLAVYEKNRNF
jgi:hypothetical protein